MILWIMNNLLIFFDIKIIVFYYSTLVKFVKKYLRPIDLVLKSAH